MTRSESSRTQARRKLRRIPGYEISVEQSLAHVASKRIADPNGYYEVLGLRPGHPWTQLQIQQAYRRAVKRYHPDGTDPNPDLFEKVTVAWETLSDLESRQQYDSLQSDSRWIDQALIDDIASKLAVKIEPHQPDLTKIVAKDLGAEPEQPQRTSWDLKRTFDSPVYYYDTNEPPERERALQLLDHTSALAWRLGYGGQSLKVGFTDDDNRIDERDWGRVLMISDEPSERDVHGYFEIDASSM